MAIELKRDYLVSEMVALQNRAFAEGQASIYAEIRKLPRPIQRTYRRGPMTLAEASEGEFGTAVGPGVHISSRCLWCKGTWAAERDGELHEESCLWFKAHAERC